MNSQKPETLVVAAVLYRSQEVLIVRRGPGQNGAGAWEFPGGKVEPEESPEQALQREIEEELGVQIQVQDFVGEVVHDYPNRRIRLRLYWAKPDREQLQLIDHDAFRWLHPREIQREELSEADRPFVEALIARMDQVAH